MGNAGAEQNRWHRRPVLAAALAAAVVAVPFGSSVIVAFAFEHLVRRPASPLWLVLWWAGLLVSSTAAFLVCERPARRALPLAALLRMGMLFPGRAPRRLAVARRAASTRDLERRLHEARSVEAGDPPTRAAERIVALAAALSVHDRRTRGHAERVRALTDLIANELHLHHDDRDRLRWSALLHDIGKLTVHSDTLNKSAPLTPDEWESLRRHPLEGARLAAPLAGWLGDWAKTIAEHHERYDGLGYPRGLAGDEISLGGRIVAVADSYDVMTSSRSYKKAMTSEAARKELAACARTQFDPEIVRALLGVSVRRLRGLAPFGWVASLPFGGVLPQAAAVGAAGARAIVAGVVAGSAIAGVTAAGWPGSAPAAHVGRAVAGAGTPAGIVRPGASEAAATGGRASPGRGDAPAAGTSVGGSAAPGSHGAPASVIDPTPAGANGSTSPAASTSPDASTSPAAAGPAPAGAVPTTPTTAGPASAPTSAPAPAMTGSTTTAPPPATTTTPPPTTT
ncbi:MAG: HD domain-containing phosphohydrolase, partial [Acidimicrobiales bacterium]